MLWAEQTRIDEMVKAIASCGESLRTTEGKRVLFNMKRDRIEIAALALISTFSDHPTAVLPEGSCMVSNFGGGGEMTSFPADGGTAYWKAVKVA